MNLLIVDDERHIVNWVQGLFEQHPMAWEIYCAYSAVEALAWMRRVRIDIVITDIHMPGMSGIELMRQIEQNWPDCQVIFLTGYSDFDYVYEAIRHDQVQYLLKTEEDEAIEQAVEQAAGRLARRYELKPQTETIDDRLILHSAWANALRMDLIPPEERTQEALSRAGIPFKADRPVFLLIAQYHQSEGLLSYAAQLRIARTLYEAGAQRLGFLFQIVQCALPDGKYIWLLQAKEDETGTPHKTTILSYLDVIQQAVCDVLDGRLSLYLYEEPLPIDRLPAQMDAMLLRTAALDAPVGSILTDAGGAAPDPAIAPFSVQDIAERLQKLPRLRAAIEEADENAVGAACAALLEGLEAVSGAQDIAATQLYMNVALALYNTIVEKGLAGAADGPDLRWLTAPPVRTSWAEAKAFLADTARWVCRSGTEHRRGYTESIMTAVCQYIEDHPEKDLSLVALAERVAYNPSYLSRAFKRHMGVNLNQYIMSARMKKAKQLLASSYLTVSEIAVQVGFDNAQYFSTAFKRLFRETPQAFRERSIKLPPEI